MKIHFKDELFDQQFLRTLGNTYYGGAEVGECFATAERITDADPEIWYAAWWRTAERLERAGEDSLAAGHTVGAREALLRASTYYRTAALFLYGLPVDRRIARASERQTAAFRRAIVLGLSSGEPIAIPYEDTTLPGYFFRADDSGQPRPTLIVTGGYDSTAEEMYCFTVVAALRRGYNCLCYDGPGQGAALALQGLHFRPDWERVVGPVVDYALTRPEVDAARLALVGSSFGGYLAPRAASGEPRLAACIADPGEFDLFDALKERFPALLARQLPDPHGLAGAGIGLLLDRTLRHPTRGWALRRGLWTHGAATPQEYIRCLLGYTLRGYAEWIACPTLVCYAEQDDLAGQARQLFEALTCPKEFMAFTGVEGAGGHCEAGGRAILHQRMFDWLDRTLGRNVHRAGEPQFARPRVRHSAA